MARPATTATHDSALSGGDSLALARQPGAGLVLGLFALGGLALQLTTYPNHDIAWILESTGRMLEGQVFGRDIVEPNPPLAWYFAMPVVLVAKATGLHAALVFRLAVAALSIALLAWSSAILRRAPGVAEGTHGVYLFAAAYVVFIGSYRDFGQREFLALLLSLPYLTMTAARLSGYQPRHWETGLAGLCAGLGIALKPYFLAAPLAVELAAMIHSRRILFAWRSEVVIAGLTLLGYGGLVVLAAPQYVVDIVPTIRQIYGHFDLPITHVMVRLVVPGLALAATLAACWRLDKTPLFFVLLAATLGFMVAYLAQSKGYSYHAFPARSLAFLCVALALTEILKQHRRRRLTFRLAVVGWCLALLFVASLERTAVWYQHFNRLAPPPVSTTSPRGDPASQAQIIALLKAYPEDETFLALSTHLYPGFPTALYVTQAWASRLNSRIFIPAIAKLRAAGVSVQDPERAFAERQARSFVLEDLSRRPVIVLVEAGEVKHGLGRLPFDLLEFYLENPRFREAWRRYRELPPIGAIRVFERHDGDVRRNHPQG